MIGRGLATESQPERCEQGKLREGNVLTGEVCNDVHYGRAPRRVAEWTSGPSGGGGWAARCGRLLPGSEEGLGADSRGAAAGVARSGLGRVARSGCRRRGAAVRAPLSGCRRRGAAVGAPLSGHLCRGCWGRQARLRDLLLRMLRAGRALQAGRQPGVARLHAAARALVRARAMTAPRPTPGQSACARHGRPLDLIAARTSALAPAGPGRPSTIVLCGRLASRSAVMRSSARPVLVPPPPGARSPCSRRTRRSASRP